MTPPDEPIFVRPGSDQPDPPPGGGLGHDPTRREPTVADARPGSPAIHPAVAPATPPRPAPSAHPRPDFAARPAHDAAPAPFGMSTVLASGALALVMGGLGAWGYQRFVEPSMAKAGVKDSAGQDGEAGGAPQAKVDDRLKDLASQVDEIRDRMAKIPKQSAPDLEPLNQRISAVEDVPRKLAALELRVSELPTRLDEEGKKLAVMSADLEGLRKQFSSLQTDVASESKPANPGAARDADVGRAASTAPDPFRLAEERAAKGPSLESGVALFRSKKYDEASRTFEELTKSNPDDARAWYYAALSRGLATRDWKGDTEALVQRGVDREKAGTPAKPEIDSAFAGLTDETGREWLAFYRNRARENNAGR
ncbi:hypothetical protein OJF2_67480 [Aquisphaera giovannonii]|uniref:Tetratricopeptide repeat protein n=1 Tax=Aquisphaera giovannonii TaxID=406548 RepID=A0A5B9WE23_9BACT|nr:hypothetical protein [Aquisphaera giovannonii]QEH38150.1 hypothetical protein OJF2_67480 [Aquisphaera giovannonii]